jgi:predicted transcriptional regulator
MTSDLKRLTAGVVARYVEGNTLAARDLPQLIESVFAAFSGADAPAAPVAEAVAKPTSGQVRKSITADALISFIDGKPYKMLKRHITQHGLTPAAYRETFGLPSDYPMTAPSYSASRSALAKSIGLGAKRKPAEETDAVVKKPRAKKAVKA